MTLSTKLVNALEIVHESVMQLNWTKNKVSSNEKNWGQSKTLPDINLWIILNILLFTDVNTTWSRSWFPLRIPSAIKEHVTKSLDLSKSPDLKKSLDLSKSPDLQKSDGSDSSIFKRSTRQNRQISPGVYSCGHQVFMFIYTGFIKVVM